MTFYADYQAVIVFLLVLAGACFALAIYCDYKAKHAPTPDILDELITESQASEDMNQ